MNTTCTLTNSAFDKGLEDGLNHYKWEPSRPFSLSYMDGYISGWLAKGKCFS